MAITVVQIIIMSVIASWVLIAAVFVWVIWWYNRNNILVSYNEEKDGVNFNTAFRCRKVKKKTRQSLVDKIKKKPFIPQETERLYKLFDFWGRGGVRDIHYSDIKDYFIVTESVPIIGVKLTLNLVKETVGGGGVQYTPWHPPEKLDSEGDIDNIVIVKVNKIRETVWESTDNSSKADMWAQIALPVGLMVLAALCVVFFPKMYDAIMAQKYNAMRLAAENWQDLIGKIKPLG